MAATGRFQNKVPVQAAFGFAVILALAGCGDPAPQPESKVAPEQPVPVETLPADLPFVEEDVPEDLYLHHRRELGGLDAIAERRYLRALVVYSKTMFFYDRGRPKGIAYEALSEFERFLNQRLKTGRLKVHVVFVPVRREQLIPNLTAGFGDIAVANLTVTPERLKMVDFSDPALDDVSEIVVTGPASPPLKTVEDLAGQEVHVRASSSYREHLSQIDSRLQSSGNPPIRIMPVDERLEDEDILEMVNAGLLGITIVDRHKADFWAKVFPAIRLHPEMTVHSGGEVAWAVRKDSPKLKQLINDFLPGHRAGTSFGNTLLRRYFRNTKWVKNSVSEKEMQKFESTVELFQKYADQYDFDWLMIAAQAYQESGLDNNVKSRSGAVGIMQVLPATAVAEPIGISNPHLLERNVHAGVKILRHYRDAYFSEEGIDEENRTLLAFAGYNAGPSRINRIRKKAAAQGLDPNLWFDNVERAVAREVGRETVQYVSNVYKYYIAYRRIVQMGRGRDAIRP